MDLFGKGEDAKHSASNGVSSSSTEDSDRKVYSEPASESRPDVPDDEAGSEDGTSSITSLVETEHDEALYDSSGAAEVEGMEPIKITASWIPSRPSKSKSEMPRLARPVAIPQIDAGHIWQPMPFSRAYSPVLDQSCVHVNDFMMFLDNLAVSLEASPVFTVMDVASLGLGASPGEWAQLTSAALGVASEFGRDIVSHARTALYLKKANRDYFAPRGLKVSLEKNAELERLVEYPQHAPTLSPLDLERHDVNIRERRLCALSEYIAPLTFEVPPPTKQRNLVDKIAAWQVKRNVNRRNKTLLRKRKRTLTFMEKIEPVGSTEEAVSLPSSASLASPDVQQTDEISLTTSNDPCEGQQKDPNGLERIVRKISNKVEQHAERASDKGHDLGNRLKRVATGESEQQQAESNLQKMEDKEAKRARRMRWIVIQNID